jgi:hypothetical protein
MTLDLSKLSDAVNKVAGLANQAAKHKDAADAANAAAAKHKADHDALLAEIKSAQAAVDTLTASLLAATTSPAEAVGIAAVAAALAPVKAPEAPVAHPGVTADLKPTHGILDTIRDALHTPIVGASEPVKTTPLPAVTYVAEAPEAPKAPALPEPIARPKLPPSMAEIAAQIAAAKANAPK